MVKYIEIPEFEEYLKKHGMPQHRSWSEVEEDAIREYYGVIPTPILAERLDRSIKAIQDKASMMGVKAEENRKRRELSTSD